MQLPAALMVALFSGFGLPAYSGAHLVAVAALLWGFAPAALCLTYLLQTAFEVNGCGAGGLRGRPLSAADMEEPARLQAPPVCTYGVLPKPCIYALLLSSPSPPILPPHVCIMQHEAWVLVCTNTTCFTPCL